MAHVGNFFREAATLAGIVVKMPFYQLGRIAALFYWPEKDVSEDIVLITGGGSGIGKGLAVKFASLGAKVVLWDLNLKAAEAAAKEINAQYANKAIAYQCDVTDRERVYSLADTVRAEVGKPTILVNNAGIVTGKKLLEADDAMMEKVIQVSQCSASSAAKVDRELRPLNPIASRLEKREALPNESRSIDADNFVALYMTVWGRRPGRLLC
eukprot:TRINITY_DN12685_c5_g1_i3.p1 TRINITY_DN12685_c5_g1~~TRINITY_DN12685_c5_g1_i3.p1  ORF type:complete len:211 (+),score=49.21 TRINITY_DN12685_c5_g1_i3:70-702(+)